MANTSKTILALFSVSALALTVLAASAEESATKRVLVTDFSGKPPYQRRVSKESEAPVAEFARFEELSEAQRARIGKTVRVTEFRGKPPFRRSAVTLDESNMTEFARFEEVSKPSIRRRRAGPPGKGFPFRR
jgi:hypothetical protein